jgi:hypothetical protein
MIKMQIVIDDDKVAKETSTTPKTSQSRTLASILILGTGNAKEVIE